MIPIKNMDLTVIWGAKFESAASFIISYDVLWVSKIQKLPKVADIHL